MCNIVNLSYIPTNGMRLLASICMNFFSLSKVLYILISTAEKVYKSKLIKFLMTCM